MSEQDAFARVAARANRREFLKSVGAGAGLALGGMADFGEAVEPVRVAALALKIRETRQVPTVCPYCAVGCGQLVHVRAGQIVNLEGNPDSPINRGSLCPKGAATFQLVVNPLRHVTVWYRAPGAKDWDKSRTLDWAMRRIAERLKQTRDETFQEFAEVPAGANQLVRKQVNHTLAIASLGGATMDNEWNYVQAKLMRALGVVHIENQARI
jgi:formate dehydrogenase major subunit